jgi:hypothetical protein
MAAALQFLSKIADEIFEANMQRAALRIAARQQVFPRHAAELPQHGI